MKHFHAPMRSMGELDPKTAAALIAAAADVALVIDRHGVIEDMALGGDNLSTDLSGAGSWIGRPWVDTVTVESRPKIEALLKEAAAGGSGKSRQINYPSVQQVDVPVLYSAIPAGKGGRIFALGRNLQQFSVMQRRLVEAQQAMELDYSRMRHVETRYRMLFRISSEPVLIVDASTQRVVEANPAAADLFGDGIASILDRPLAEAFEPAFAAPLRDMLAVVRAAGRADELRATLRGRAEDLSIAAFTFRQDGASLFLIRLQRTGPNTAAGAVPKLTQKLLKFVENAPDGFVVTDDEGRVLSVNAAFLDMAQLTSDLQVVNEPLDRWLGRPGVDLSVLIANLRERGAVRLFASVMRGDLGSEVAIEISAAAVLNGERNSYGFVIRNIGRRLKSDAQPGPELPKSVAHLTELVGRVSLKDLVREATDVIEKLSIEAALQMTGDNRASAAEMLGLSRQSLYVKLRRYGLADIAVEPGVEGE